MRILIGLLLMAGGVVWWGLTMFAALNQLGSDPATENER